MSLHNLKYSLNCSSTFYTLYFLYKQRTTSDHCGPLNSPNKLVAGWFEVVVIVVRGVNTTGALVRSTTRYYRFFFLLFSMLGSLRWSLFCKQSNLSNSFGFTKSKHSFYLFRYWLESTYKIRIYSGSTFGLNTGYLFE